MLSIYIEFKKYIKEKEKIMSLKTEKKLVITETMSVDYVAQNGNSGQRVLAKFFDADDSGDYTGEEVKLFNNCVFTLGENNITIYDKEMQQQGYGGKIVIDASEYGPYLFDSSNLKYKKSNLGNKCIGYLSCENTFTGKSFGKEDGFDEIHVDWTGESFVVKKSNSVPWYEKFLEKIIDKIK